MNPQYFLHKLYKFVILIIVSNLKYNLFFLIIFIPELFSRFERKTEVEKHNNIYSQAGAIVRGLKMHLMYKAEFWPPL